MAERFRLDDLSRHRPRGIPFNINHIRHHQTTFPHYRTSHFAPYIQNHSMPHFHALIISCPPLRTGEASRLRPSPNIRESLTLLRRVTGLLANGNHSLFRDSFLGSTVCIGSENRFAVFAHILPNHSQIIQYQLHPIILMCERIS